MKEQKWIHEGLITESLPNGMFRVHLSNENLILGYISGRIRRSLIRILRGDRGKIEISRFNQGTYNLQTSQQRFGQLDNF